MRIATGSAIATTLLCAWILVQEPEAEALPMYAMRSVRTCGNCHVSPTVESKDGWNNPELSERKCNMSCMSCHVNPTGGGLRNSGGRYYGQSTLAMLPLQDRSYSDFGREIFDQSTIKSFRNAFRADDFQGHRGEGRFVPSNYEDVLAGMGQGQSGGVTAYGKPLLGPSKMSFWDGRYGDLNADPLFQFGGDLRSAAWLYDDGSAVFPMQMDLHAALHPVEHLTTMVTLAGQGRAGVRNPGEIAAEPDPVFLRNAFVMVHELPYMAYAKAGIFMPAFGTHIDDHTSFTRQYFEMDVSTRDSTVYGVEIGAAPNYPFVSASLFGNRLPQYLADREDVNPGWGGALNLGWRDFGWWGSAHAMIKRRDLAAFGDLDAAGLAWGFNPFSYSNSLPLSYMGEASFGRGQAAVTGRETRFVAMYHEAWWLLFNGVNLRVKYDWGNRDVELAGTTEHRFSGGVDLTPVPGITFVTLGRYLMNEGRQNEWDVFFHTHFWF